MAFGNKNSTPSFALTLPMKVTTNGQRKALHGRALSAIAHDNSKWEGDDSDGAGNYQCRRHIND